MESDETKKLKQEIMELSIELAKQQDEIDDLKKYKQMYITKASEVLLLKEILHKHNIKF